jgi:hypothetical protein
LKFSILKNWNILEKLKHPILKGWNFKPSKVETFNPRKFNSNIQLSRVETCNHENLKTATSRSWNFPL